MTLRDLIPILCDTDVIMLIEVDGTETFPDMLADCTELAVFVYPDDFGVFDAWTGREVRAITNSDELLMICISREASVEEVAS
jgi:hypothetical protein